jgi:hypothetical protein
MSTTRGTADRCHRRLLRRRAPGRSHDGVADRGPEARGAVDGKHRPAPDRLDERHPVLSREACADRSRAHRVRRLALGADLGLTGSVLAVHRLVGVRRWRSEGHSVGGHFGLGDARHALRQAGEGMRSGRNQERGSSSSPYRSAPCATTGDSTSRDGLARRQRGQRLLRPAGRSRVRSRCLRL